MSSLDRPDVVMTPLAADDDPEILTALAAFGKKRGYTVYTSARGDEALEFRRGHEAGGGARAHPGRSAPGRCAPGRLACES